MMHEERDQEQQNENLDKEIEQDAIDELSDDDLEDVAGGWSWHPDKNNSTWDDDHW